MQKAIDETKKWLEANEVKPYAFARSNDIDPSDFNKFIRGEMKRAPSIVTITKIVKGTHGAVTADMFVEV